jgi:hypothetical protein
MTCHRTGIPSSSNQLEPPGYHEGRVGSFSPDLLGSRLPQRRGYTNRFRRYNAAAISPIECTDVHWRQQ